VKGFELGILQGYNHEKHVSSTGGVRILNGIAQLKLSAALRLCARCLIFKLHFSYLLNRHLKGCLHDGRRDDFDVLKY
jgi:hypothetical protein